MIDKLEISNAGPQNDSSTTHCRAASLIRLSCTPPPYSRLCALCPLPWLNQQVSCHNKIFFQYFCRKSNVLYKSMLGQLTLRHASKFTTTRLFGMLIVGTLFIPVLVTLFPLLCKMHDRYSANLLKLIRRVSGRQ